MGARRFSIDYVQWWNGADSSASLQIAWIGQAGFLIRWGDYRVAIDPYLSDSLAAKYGATRFPHRRMKTIPIQAEELARANVYLCTHEHGDHLDPDTVKSALERPGPTRIVAPRYSLDTVIARGVDPRRAVFLNNGETWSDGTIDVHALPAAHESVETDEFGNHRFLGYLIRLGSATVYHSGDTVPCEVLERSLEALLAQGVTIDLALLPVNGRDELRLSNGIAGNLTVFEAIDYHQRFSFGHTILHHFGMFDFNSVEPAFLRDVVRGRGLRGTVIIPDMEYAFEIKA